MYPKRGKENMADLLDARRTAMQLLRAVNDNQAKGRTDVTVRPHVEAERMGWGTGPEYIAALNYLTGEGALVEELIGQGPVEDEPVTAGEVPVTFRITEYGLGTLAEEG
jgi:hypothetical protein